MSPTIDTLRSQTIGETSLWLEETLSQLQDNDPRIVSSGYPAVLRAPLHQRLLLVERMLHSTVQATRLDAAILLGSMIVPESDVLLDEALSREGDDAVLRALHVARFALHLGRTAAQWPMPEAPAYSVPVDTPLGEDALTILRTRCKELIASYRQRAAELLDQFGDRAKSLSDYRRAVEISQSLEVLDVEDLLAFLNGDSEHRRFSVGEEDLINGCPELWTLPDFSLWTACRISFGASRLSLLAYHGQKMSFSEAPIESQDLRAVDDVCQAISPGSERGVPSRVRELTGGAYRDKWPGERVWPFFARYPALVSEGMMLRALRRRFSMSATPWYPVVDPIEISAKFPWLQPEWLSPLLAMAFGKYRDNRIPAKRLLSRQPMLSRGLEVLLSSPRVDFRVEAAQWLDELRDPEMLPVLREALANETSDEVRAHLLAALEHLDEDISTYLSKEVLLRDAEAGRGEKVPANFNWFPFDELPTCHWESGGDVDRIIIRWWVLLAWRLGDPKGNALLDRYLGQLTPVSRSSLGSFIFKAFLAYDTRPPAEKTILARAQVQLQDYIAMRMRNSFGPSTALTAEEEQTYLESCMRRERRECVGSAISAKGILALAAHAPGHELASRTRTFLRDHHRRMAQTEALLELLAHSGNRSALQVLFRVSRGYRKDSIQTKAGVLIEEIAQRNNWTEQQLADRSVPTAGFDDNGEQILDYGERTFRVELDGSLRPLLKNSEGKILKALPEARTTEDPDQVKAAKAQFTGCKKELKQVVEQQRIALREAMCVGRTWTVDEWQALIMMHPILGRLAQQLIWQQVDANGHAIRHFRPGSDGAPIDTEDELVTFDPVAVIRLTHGTLMSAEESRAWATHLWDYKVTPLFPQINRPTPSFDMEDPPFEVLNPLSGTTSPGILGGALDKLGFIRGGVGDGGWVSDFRRRLSFDPIVIVFGVDGIFVQGGVDGDARLTSLRFENALDGRSLRLDQVPNALLAESYADFMAVAGACTKPTP